MTHGEMHGDSTGGARIGRETIPRGVCDQAGEVFRAAASAAERAASEWAREKEGGSARGRGRKKAEARRVLRVTKEFKEDVEWSRWCLKGA